MKLLGGFESVLEHFGLSTGKFSVVKKWFENLEKTSFLTFFFLLCMIVVHAYKAVIVREICTCDSRREF